MHEKTRKALLAEALSRRECGELLGLHPDSVTRALGDGLASAVVRWGGRGKTMAFSRLMVLRWQRARLCTRNGGRPCRECNLVLDRAAAVASHLLEKRHGVLDSCSDDCGYPGGICQPCA